MESKSLMIGDWVTNRTNTINEKIDKEFLIGLLSGKYEETEVFPIPLTAEILEKNGLGSKQQDTPMVSLHIYGDGWDEKSYSYIKYVHQLQQALRHCGLNYLADNFRLD